MLFKVFVYWKLKLLNFLMDFVLTSHVHIQPSVKVLVVDTKETDQSKCLHFRDVLFSWDQVYFKGFSGSLISSLIIFRECWFLTSRLLWIGRFTWLIVIFSHVSAVQNKSLSISCWFLILCFNYSLRMALVTQIFMPTRLWSIMWPVTW